MLAVSGNDTATVAQSVPNLVVQVVDTLGERMDQLESSVMDDWAERVAEQGYQSEKEMFDDMYNVKKMSMRTMAEVLKTSKFTVQKRMDKQGLKRRKVGQKVK